MADQSWQKVFSPPAGGWSRLSAKLGKVEELQSQEIRVWRMAATLMIVAVFLVSLQKSPGTKAIGSVLTYPKAAEVLLEEGHASQVPGTPAGIRFYWIFSEPSTDGYREKLPSTEK